MLRTFKKYIYIYLYLHGVVNQLINRGPFLYGISQLMIAVLTVIFMSASGNPRSVLCSSHWRKQLTCVVLVGHVRPRINLVLEESLQKTILFAHTTYRVLVFFPWDKFWNWDPSFNVLLVGGLEHVFDFPYIGNNTPIWLSDFSEG